jgi:uncharacterized repeat protein (TIGR01451 family)
MSFSVRGPRVLPVPFFVLFALLTAFGLTAVASAQPAAQTDHQAPVSMQPSVVSAVGHKPTTVTDAQGAFRFEGLARGTHQIYLDPSTLPANLRASAAATEITLWLNPGQTLVSDPIGRGVRFSATYDPAGSVISGVVFVDQNHDGHRSPGERGLAGVTVIDPTIHQYFIPFDDLDLIALLTESNRCQGQQGGGNSVGDIVASRISLTASSNGTIFYYDHWEDGYDADPQQPGPTTLVGTLEAGQTRIFEDEVDTTQLQTTFYFDGRDRISVFGEPASVIRAASPSLLDSSIGTRLAGAWEIDEVANWGRAYVVPAGEDWGAGADFEFAGATVTALQNGTQVFLNGAPLDPLEPTIGAGETVFRNGAGDGPGGDGLDSGDTITATGPIQVHLYGSLCTFPRFWSGNGYTLEPRGQWNSDYWSPVPRRTAGPTCRASADTDVYLYNDTGSPFNITIDDGTPATVSLPPGSSNLVALHGPLSDIQGIHIFAPGGQPFWGVANVDTGDVIFEWGYSLIPADELSSQVVFGWAPGNDLDTPISQPQPSGNLAFVTAITDTVVFADFDQDGNADMMDCNGDGDFNDPGVCAGLDEINSRNGITLTQGQTLQVADPYDADLTGALLFTADLREKIAVAWGEDSCIADVGVPYLDMGYTVLPIGVPSISKADTLVVDVDMSGNTTPGDILQYTVLVANNGRGVMNNVILTDVLPYTHTDFVAFSIDVSVPPPTSTYAYDDGSGLFNHTLQPAGDWDVDPAVQQFRITWPQINAGQTVSVTFRVQIDPDLPPDVREITNVALLNSDNTPLRSSEDPDCPDPDCGPGTVTIVGEPPILWLNKLPSDPTTVAAGGYLTYTIVVSNVGNGAALSALVLDNLPPWLTYVPDTLDLTLPVAQFITTTTPVTIVSLFDDTYGDNFDDVTHTLTVWPGGNDGTLAWTAPLSEWIELGDDGNPNTGDVQVVNTGARTPPGALQISDGNTVDVESGAMRCADLSDFVEPHLRFQMQGDTSVGAADTFRVVITSTTSAAVTTVTEQRNVATYVLEDIDLSAYALQLGVCVSFVTDAGLDPDDFYRVDDVFIYENAPFRSEVVDRADRTTSVSYSTFTNINPVTYTRILPDPTTIAITHTMNVTDAFPFPPQSRLTTTFQVQVGYPLTDGLQMINTASITATNLISTPYPLQDSEPTQIQSNHVLTVTKTDEPDPVPLGELLTYTLSWEVAGNEPAPGVDVLPLPYVSFVSCAPLPACQGETAPGSGEVTWDLGNRLPPMSQVTRDGGTLTLTVRVDARPPNGVFTNTVYIDDATDTPIDQDDEPTRVPLGSFTLSKQRLTTSPITVTEQVEFLIVITNTGVITINRLPLEDTYDPVYLGYVDALPAPDSVSPGSLTWNDLTVNLPGAVLPPGESTQVWVQFEALTNTQSLTPPVTINTAVSEGAETETGEVLPRQEDDASVGIIDESPTAIQLLYFRAQPKADGVLVQWATLVEIDTYGFWLYRSDDADLGHAVPVVFVAAKGWGVFGAVYQYLDDDLPSGLYHYWLVEVENGGSRATYGPTSTWSGSGVADLPYHIYLPLIRRP